MTNSNYAAMTDTELRHYLLLHRDDQAAFYAYMDRRSQRDRLPGIPSDDPEWDEKVLTLMRSQLAAKSNTQ